MSNNRQDGEGLPQGLGSDPLGVAIIGCGYWGVNYVRVLSEMREARLLSICDRRADRVAEIQRNFLTPHATTQLEEVIHLPGVAAVVVCTEATTHYEISRRCLLAGKHILVEKPITTTVRDAEELTALAESQSAILMVGHTFVFNAAIHRVKEYIQQAQEPIYYLYARRTNLGPIRRDVNAVWDLAPHDIAIFNYLLDAQPEWVSAVGAKVLRNCREDVAFISLGYRDNIIGHIHVSWADPNKSREVVVVGSERRIVFNDLNSSEQVRVFEKGVAPINHEPRTFGEYQFQIREGDIISPHIPLSEPLKNECRHFLECVRLRRQPVSSGRHGREVVRTLEAIDCSIKENGAQVEVSRRNESVARQAIAVASAIG